MLGQQLGAHAVGLAGDGVDAYAVAHECTTSGRLARDFATQEHYDEFLARLHEHEVDPATVVLDDKWQSTYGRNEPDTEKWPDLESWIAALE